MAFFRLLRAVVALLIFALAARPVSASAEEPFTSFRAARWQPPTSAHRFTGPPVEARRDYRWVGTAVVGIGLGTAAVLVTRAACGNSENGPRDCTGLTLGVGLLGAAVGGVVGNLLGRLVHRH